MTPSSFLELRKLLAERGLPDNPTYIPTELITSEMLLKYKELHSHHLNTLKEKNINNEEFLDLMPFLFDFINIPIKCDFIDEIEVLLNNEPLIGESLNEPIISTPEIKTDFKTARNTPVKQAENDCKQSEGGIDKHIIERIEREIIDKTPKVSWDDIAGLANVKRTINEIVVWPVLRPDVFKGIRNPPKGVLLFGPPGTGKTMIGKCIASQCKATFFSISASSLTSKWVGEGEKTVRALFSLARKYQPSVIFIDEIDSLLSQRTENENEASRRIKTEFLVQFDGVGTEQEESVLIVGATNRPSEIDEAARRRLVKRIYVPLPDIEARSVIVKHLMKDYKSSLVEKEYLEIAKFTDGYSGSDLFNLCREVAMEPVREIVDIANFNCEDMRNVNFKDFINSMGQIRKSVSEDELVGYENWNKKFGSI